MDGWVYRSIGRTMEPVNGVCEPGQQFVCEYIEYIGVHRFCVSNRMHAIRVMGEDTHALTHAIVRKIFVLYIVL